MNIGEEFRGLGQRDVLPLLNGFIFQVPVTKPDKKYTKLARERWWKLKL